VSRGEQGARASQGLVEGEALDLEGGCRRRVSTAKRFNVGINRPPACRRSELNERLGDSGLNQLPCHPPAANGKHLADEAIRGIATEKRRE
jgi:hypothetical protein